MAQQMIRGYSDFIGLATHLGTLEKSENFKAVTWRKCALAYGMLPCLSDGHKINVTSRNFSRKLEMHEIDC